MKRFRRTRLTNVMAAMVMALIAAGTSAVNALAATDPKAGPFVRVSPRDARYLELSDGRPFIPIGLNLCWPLHVSGERESLETIDRWLGKLAAHGGNLVRVWLGAGFFDIEHAKSGTYDEQKARRIDAVFQLARKHGIRLKLTLENFREVDPETAYAQKKASQVKAIHHVSQGGPAKSMDDWFSGQASRAQFRRKLAWYGSRYGSDPLVFAWELWNEVNATQSKLYLPWTEEMLGQLHRLFPQNMAVQSLGSFDRDSAREANRRDCLLPGNSLAQVHRYLDLGAALQVCHGPMDVLTADAVREILVFHPGKPVLLAESGAVEPSHSGPFKLYDKDKAGMILHDVLFAPFFAGAAGTGQCWHWDVYIDRNDLWWHFARFAAVVEGLDPPAEGFQPLMLDQPQVRVYALRGRHTTLLWCRDKENTWQAELADGIQPRQLSDVKIDLHELKAAPAVAAAPAVSSAAATAPRQQGSSATRVRTYDPWENRWTEGSPDEHDILRLPAWRRSIVVRIEHK